MKRNKDGRSKIIDWNKCLICQSKNKSDLRSSDEFLKTLATNLVTFWKHDRLDLHWEALAELDDGMPNFYESFRRNGARAHKNCDSKYNKQKVERMLIAEGKEAAAST